MENDQRKNVNLIAKGVVKGIAKSLLAFIVIPATIGGVCYLLFGTDENGTIYIGGITFIVFLISVIIGTLSD